MFLTIESRLIRIQNGGRKVEKFFGLSGREKCVSDSSTTYKLKCSPGARSLKRTKKSTNVVF